MCQVTPFTFPCCQRIYVSVEKLPNCPSDWPKSKCPKELCIQINHNENKKHVPQRPSGICWRCRAAADGRSGAERDRMRPEIDRAKIVEGLEEFDALERRDRAERSGTCWFCSAHKGGGHHHSAVGMTASGVPTKRRGQANMRSSMKKSKVGAGAGKIAMSSSMRPPPLLGGPSTSAHYQPSDKSFGVPPSPEMFDQTYSIPAFHGGVPRQPMSEGIGCLNAWRNLQGGQGNSTRAVGRVGGEQHPINPHLEPQPPETGMELGTSCHDQGGMLPEFSHSIVDFDDAEFSRMLEEYTNSNYDFNNEDDTNQGTQSGMYIGDQQNNIDPDLARME